MSSLLVSWIQSDFYLHIMKHLNGNMRDYASLNELLVLTNMGSYNAVLIGKGMDQKERMIELRKLARTQLMSLEKLSDSGIKRLEGKN